MKFSPEQRSREVRNQLLAWYRKNGRDLPWRKTNDPYRVWISEVMLQQTQVTRVVDYYERFLRRFPDIQKLARASWREVLPVWRGLGYYRRGGNLLRGAKQIVKTHGGIFPREAEMLREIAGIGPYTASAIQTFAFNKNVAAIDTNLRRVLARVFRVDPEKVEQRSEILFQGLQRGAPELNHALMDLGATICQSRIARCEICPLQKICASAFKIPAAKRNVRSRDKTPARTVAVACIWGQQGYLKWKSSAAVLFQTECQSLSNVRGAIKTAAAKELHWELAVRPPYYSHSQTVNGVVTRYHFCRCQILRGNTNRLPRGAKWQSAKALLLATKNESEKLALAALPGNTWKQTLKI